MRVKAASAEGLLRCFDLLGPSTLPFESPVSLSSTVQVTFGADVVTVSAY